ncbi:MAG: hypothetical protein ACTHWQ_01435, partial [Sphingobacterium sp.]
VLNTIYNVLRANLFRQKNTQKITSDELFTIAFKHISCFFTNNPFDLVELPLGILAKYNARVLPNAWPTACSTAVRI